MTAKYPGLHPCGSKRPFPKLNNVPTPRDQKIVKNHRSPHVPGVSTLGKANDRRIMMEKKRLQS